MSEYQQRPEDEATRRAASFIAQALKELQQTGAAAEMQAQIESNRVAFEQAVERVERQLADEREQRAVMAGQLTTLATSLDRLVNHLQSLSQLMADMLERLVTPAGPAPQAPSEPSFAPGGEGVSLALIGVPGFQVLMDIQKGLSSLKQVAGVSVEHFQEGDSRVLVHLREPITAGELAAALRVATGQAFAVEESRPELMRLRLKFVGTA